MEFQFCSDLHLEFDENRHWLERNMLEPVADVLVLAWDIVCLNAIGKADWFLDWVSENFQEAYWIPGNHEYYHGSIEGIESFQGKIRHNVNLVNNVSVELGGLIVHFSTLWTEIPERNARIIEKRMADYHVIKKDGETLTVADTNPMFRLSRNFIMDALETNHHKKQVVVTHHVPTYSHYPPEYLGSPLNTAFAVELDPMIERLNPAAWLFGHSHSNIGRFKVGDTLMLTNQLGYVGYGEQKGFVRNALVRI
jgi:Icc-related predicted phosphoesterase